MNPEKRSHIDNMLDNRLFFEKVINLLKQDRIQFWFEFTFNPEQTTSSDQSWTQADNDRLNEMLEVGMIDGVVALLENRIKNLDQSMSWLQSSESDFLYPKKE